MTQALNWMDQVMTIAQCLQGCLRCSPFQPVLCWTGRVLLTLAGVALGDIDICLAAEQPFADTVQRIKPSIVGIATYEATRRPPTKLLGTGFVVADGYYVATNDHVVGQSLDIERHERWVVLVGSGEQIRAIPAQLVTRERQWDLALLRIDTQLPALTLSSAPVREGEIYAFTGFPIGGVLGLYPVTHRGMVSSLTPIAIPAPGAEQLSARKINRLKHPLTVYQLDATAYPGNSGSPLYTMDTGEVVGILNQVYVKATKEDVLSQPSGISYAIPVRYLRTMLERVR